MTLRISASLGYPVQNRSLRAWTLQKSLPALLVLSLLMAGPLFAADLFRSNFDNVTTVDNPWSGASTTGVLAVTPGKQPAVDNAGKVTVTQFSPSVTVGDLNGDGIPDLVIGDAYGYFWFYPNSGTANQPQFTHGEIMPIWFGATKDQPDYDSFFGGHSGGAENVVPRIQLVSLGANPKLLDLVIGNYNGRLFYLHNIGSVQMPQFRVTPSRQAGCLIKTRRDGLLWCNFFAPTLYDWYGTGNLDLIMGDGSYSANSVFLFKNMGSRDVPTFNEDNKTKIVPGMGREDIVPQVVDWNNDGKLDIICGDRLGHISLFLNTTASDKASITFDQGTNLRLGSKDTFGDMATVTVCDLTGNKLPNLIITNNKGDILYAQNNGKPGSPQFADPVPIKGQNPFPKILRPAGWKLYSPYGVPNELLVTTNVSVQPEFTPPPNTPFKSAMRYYVYPITNKYFPEFYYPISDDLFDDTHVIRDENDMTTTDNTAYHVSFWIRTSGNISNLKCGFFGWRIEPGEDDDSNGGHIDATIPIGSSGSWTLFEGTLRYTFQNKKKPIEHEQGKTWFQFTFNGQGEIYLDDVAITPQ